MPTVPGTLALTTIADGAAAVAADLRNNYSAVQVGVNGLIAMFTNAATKGDLIVSQGGGTIDKLAVGSNGQSIVADSTQPLGVKWGSPASAYLRKTTQKVVVNTVVETDLLNAEFSIPANTLGANGGFVLRAYGDWLNTSGGAQSPPRFKLKLGSGPVIFFDTNALSAVMGNSAQVLGWDINIVVQNAAATNGQVATFVLNGSVVGASASAASFFSGGVGTFFAITNPAGVMTITGQASQAIASPSGVDTTASMPVVLSVINGAANANYNTTLLGAVLNLI